MYFRVKRTGSYAYLQIVESFRDKGQVHQRVLSNLGRLDVLQATGRLEKLMRSGLRFCEQLAVIDAHGGGRTQPVQVQRVGPDLVFGRLWESLRLGTILQRALESRRFEFDVERAVYLTVLHRLFAPGSDRAAERWRQAYRLAGTEELDLHHLYRAMAFLGEPLDEASGARVLNTPRCTKDWIEEQLFDQRRDLFSTIDLVFFDTTSIYFEGEGGQEIGRYGKSKDHRPDLKQVVVGLALDLHGWPLCCELWPGNTADVTTLLPVVNRMRQRFRVRRVSIVADRGMISADTIAALESEALDCDYILGARMPSVKEISQRVLADRRRYQEVTPKRKTSKDPSPLKVKEVVIGERRYIVCLNEEQRRKDAADRQAIVEHLREQLKRGDKDLIGNKGYRKYCSQRAVVTERAARLVSLAYNLWSLFTRLMGLTPGHHSEAVKSRRDFLFLAAQVVESGRQRVVKLAVKAEWWSVLNACYERLRRWLAATAPQLEAAGQLLRRLARQTAENLDDPLFQPGSG